MIIKILITSKGTDGSKMISPHHFHPTNGTLGFESDESEPILDRVIESCRNCVQHGVS